jgi:hypothetical protein
MLPKKLIEFHNVHKGEKIIVCGCGISLKEFEPNHKEFITIGVNDVPALFNPTYLLVTDHPNRFNDNRKKLINEAEVRGLFTCVSGWRNPKIIHFDLGKKGASYLDDPTKVDHFLNSPYTAINVAYKMGAETIGLIGVDFTDGHFYSPKDGQHSLARMGYLKDLNGGYSLIARELENRGVSLFNLSKNSRIDTVKKITLEEFKEL